MAKYKLNEQQTRRINKNQETATMSESTQTGTIIARFANEVDIETDQGDIRRSHLRQNLKTLVPGDRIAFEQTADTCVIVALHPRKTLLARETRFKKKQPVAANITQMLITITSEPHYSLFLLDCYLMAAELANITPLIVFNKTDLLENPQEEKEHLAFYEQLGYPVYFISTVGTPGLDALRAALPHQTSVLLGQSGVGKSSIINQLLPNENIKTTAISSQQLGRHTTTTARLYHLPSGGDLIDSPGIRAFMPPAFHPEDLFDGFVEFKPYKNQCRFKNCSHTHEPECALKQAVEAGEIRLSRFQHFQKLRLEKQS
jgi:ribosome biogenesis GTPase / thiamine phosphate phosphatase